MTVKFRTKKLESCYEDFRKASKRWGKSVARRYIQRINILEACATREDVQSFPQLKLHLLKGNRRGQEAIRLDGFMRLIVTFRQQSERLSVRIEEVTKHYGN